MTSKKQIFITKASGIKEIFSVEKLSQSLKKAGAGEQIISEIVSDIDSWIIEGMSTRNIYNRAFSLLRKSRQQLAAKYKLKNAMMELGPTGHPFEFFTGQILQSLGYSTEVAKVIEGYCIKHEVDVIATKGKTQFFVECKFYHSQDKLANVQVPLYIKSRVDDIIRRRKDMKEYEGFNFQGWIVTNTRFTLDALEFGQCSGLQLLSWDFPKGKGLREIIDQEKIFPVTVLTSLNKSQKQNLLEKAIVICRQIHNNPDIVNFLQLKEKQKINLFKEVDSLCAST